MLPLTLTIGTRLGVYDITAPIGEGGMGQVYRATDTKLKRQVAIKVLPPSLATDHDRLARFQREAEVLASLNHPHIAGIYGLEESAGITALVMELVEGEDLSQRIARGAVPIDEALPIAKQIADALEAAHEQGIVHRDLKPANIKVRADGTVKVLDFGLAKALETVPGLSSSVSMSPTITTPAMTQAGMILGTAAYMAPEQARGKRVDKRADIWAFGVVLFEMLTGRCPFVGDDDVMATVASVIKDQPAFAALPPETPTALRRLLRRCLEKDPGNRLADIADARLEIAEALEAKPEIKAVPLAGRSRAIVWQTVAAVLAIVAALGWWNGWRARRSTPSAETPAFRVDLDLGPDVSPDSMGPAAILSPTGGRVAFISTSQDAQTRLLTKSLDEPKAMALPGTEGAYGPFFSADGQWIGFFAGGKLKKTRIDGTQIVTLCDASAGRGASWSDDGAFIVAALDNQSSLVRIPAEGGTPVPLTKLNGEERTHRWPQVLPGHHAVLFTANSSAGNFIDSRIGVVTIADGQTAPSDHKILLDDSVMYPRYIASGNLVFVKKSGLYAASFDQSQLRIVGTPVQVLEDVSNDTSFGTVQIDVSASGTLLYHRGGSVGLRSIQWLRSGGQVEPLLPEAAMYIYPRIASEGDRVAYSNADESNGDIWVFSTRTRTKTRLTSGLGAKAYPTWSPDGRYLVFSTAGTLFWVPADAARPPQVLMRGGGTIAPTAFSPDGKTLAFVERSADRKWSLRTVSIRTSPNGLEAGAPEPFVDVPSGAATAAFSPDGRWLAYTSAESGPFEVYVRGFPDKGTKRLVSSGGGMMPMWSSNGKDIFYRTQDQRLMVASYSVKDGSFIADPPRPWSTQRLANIGMTGNVDLAPDGTRFVVLMPAEAAESRETRGHYTLVTNFFDAVRHRLAASPR